MESKKLKDQLKLLMKFRPEPEDIKLKPCPFCGCSARMYAGDGGDYYDDFLVACGDRDCGGERGTGSWRWSDPPDEKLRVKYETILLWNQRVK